MTVRRIDGRTTLAQLVASEHAYLERLFQSLMSSLRGGEAQRLRVRWLELDHALERHLGLEEELVLPRLEREFPASAARLRRQHREVRMALVQLGLDLDLQEQCPGSAVRFISAMRRHTAYEGTVVTPWAHEHLGEAERLQTLERLRELNDRHDAASRLDETQPS